MLLEFWKNHSSLDFHPLDKDFFEENNYLNNEYIVNGSFDQVLKEFGENLKLYNINDKFKAKIDQKRIIRRLLPSPFVGNINKANVYILSGNPGFHSGYFLLVLIYIFRI